MQLTDILLLFLQLNNTAQSLLDADSSLKSILNVINSSLTSQVSKIPEVNFLTDVRMFIHDHNLHCSPLNCSS